MSLNSMTGFARTQGAHGPIAWHWEIRAVNGRGLDLRLRLAPGFEGLEARVREIASRYFQRGNLQINLSATRAEGVAEIRLSETTLAQVLRAADRVRALTQGAAPTVEGLLGLRGVLEYVQVEESEEVADARQAAMIASFEEACAGVVVVRAAEGQRLAVALTEQVAEIERIVAAVAASPSRSTEAIRRRLGEQLARLAANTQAFDETRLHQEAVLLATRADVEEELKRLAAHLAAARDLLASGAGAGRKLDFLTQEFNREANTLCSKSNDIEITRLGLSLKSVIDQMREQVQNIE